MSGLDTYEMVAGRSARKVFGEIVFFEYRYDDTAVASLTGGVFRRAPYHIQTQAVSKNSNVSNSARPRWIPLGVGSGNSPCIDPDTPCLDPDNKETIR